MTTRQQFSKYLEDFISYLEHWYQNSTFPIRNISLTMAALIFFSGLFFWASQFDDFFGGYQKNHTELEVARSGLQTMKRMVGDQRAWSETIREEYNRIYLNESALGRSPDDNSNQSNTSATQSQCLLSEI